MPAASTMGSVFLYLGLMLFLAVGWGFWFFQLFCSPKLMMRFDWVWCGLAGFCAHAIFLQNLVYLNQPLRITACLGAIIAAVGLALMIIRTQWSKVTREIRLDIITVSAIGVIVFCLQGWALLRTGSENYFGRARFDQVNYVQTAEFLVEKPFHTELADIGLHPWLLKGVIGTAAAAELNCQWELLNNDYNLDKVNNSFVREARDSLRAYPDITYLIEGDDSLATAWLCYYGRSSDVYLYNNKVGDVKTPMDSFEFRRAPAGLRNYRRLNTHGVFDEEPYEPAPRLDIAGESWKTTDAGANFYGSDSSLAIRIHRYGENPSKLKSVFEAFISTQTQDMISVLLVDKHTGGSMAVDIRGQGSLQFEMNLEGGVNDYQLTTSLKKPASPCLLPFKG